MRILVKSRAQIEAIDTIPPEWGRTLLISINTTGDKRARVGHLRGLRARLFLTFDDLSRLTLEGCVDDSGRLQHLMTENDANYVLDAIDRHKPDTIICQCAAGQSRSAGLAAALAVLYGVSDAPFYSGDKKPNSHVKSLTLRVARERASHGNGHHLRS